MLVLGVLSHRIRIPFCLRDSATDKELIDKKYAQGPIGHAAGNKETRKVNHLPTPFRHSLNDNCRLALDNVGLQH